MEKERIENVGEVLCVEQVEEKGRQGQYVYVLVWEGIGGSLVRYDNTLTDISITHDGKLVVPALYICREPRGSYSMDFSHIHL